MALTILSEENKHKRGKNDNKERNIQLARWIVENPYDEFKETISGGKTKRCWLERMFKENNIHGRSLDAMSSKVAFIRKKYQSAKQWSEIVGQNVLLSQGAQVYKSELLKLCPWFYIFDGIRQSYQTNASSDCSSIQFDLSAPDDESQNECEVSHSLIKIKCESDEVDEEPEALELNLIEDDWNSNSSRTPSSILPNSASSYSNFQDMQLPMTNCESVKRKLDIHSALLELRKMKKHEEIQEKNEKQNESIELLKLQFEREKFEWEKQDKVAERQHEKEMMMLEIRKLELQLQLQNKVPN